jgi:chlorite dismutase
MTEVLETLEGWYISHDFRCFDWAAWNMLSEREKLGILESFTCTYNAANAHNTHCSGSFAMYEILGNKADFLFLNLRSSLEALADAERAFSQMALSRFMPKVYSYTAVAELSNYVHSTETRSPEARAMIDRRLQPAIPNSKHICFYPMNKRRGEHENWYSQTLEERKRMMRDHGMTGRRYAGKIVQMIGGSMGFDDWEWGVTLFAQEALELKHIVTEMRFDEVSARFAEFGPFYIGNLLGLDDCKKIFSPEQSPNLS